MQQKRNAVAKAVAVGAAGAYLLAQPASRAFVGGAEKGVNADIPTLLQLGVWYSPESGPLTSNLYNNPNPIDKAAAKLSDAAYPFMKEVDWTSVLYLQKPGGSASALDWLKAVDKALVMGEAMDAKTLKDAAMAHHKAIGTIDTKGLLNKADFTAINAGIGKLIASVPAEKTMDVYNSFKGLVGADVPAYLMSQVNEADAKKAYAALMEFKDVVKKNPTPVVEPVVNPQLSQAKLAAIDTAAAKLSAASYPFIKDVDWTSDLYTTPLPGVDGIKALKAIDSMIVLGATMDSKLLKDAVKAHHDAIAGVDAKGVLTAADYAKVNGAIGKIIASAPQSKVMDVYNSFAKILDPSVGNNLFSSFSKGAAGADAIAAYRALMEFKDVVKAAQL